AESNRRAEETQKVIDYLAKDVFGAATAHKSHGRAVTVLDLLSRSDEDITARFRAQPLVEAAVRMALGETYAVLIQNDKAERQYARAAALRARHLGPEHPDTLRAERGQADMLRLEGDRIRRKDRRALHEAGEKLYRHVLAVYRRVHHPDTAL